MATEPGTADRETTPAAPAPRDAWEETVQTEIESGGSRAEAASAERAVTSGGADPGTTAFGAYLVVFNVFLFYGLLKVWPESVPLADADRVITLFGGLWAFEVGPEVRYLLIVMMCGALGSFVHVATSFADFVGNRQLAWNWGIWYVLRPFIGMALAVVFFFVIRGGLIMGDAGVENLSPYGVAAIAGLTGLFSRQATDKLRDVFENLFQTSDPPERKDALRPGRPR